MPVPKKAQLLLIDPQHDFCDIPNAKLPVPGANADMVRLSQLIDRIGHTVEHIYVTLDSHSTVHIAHPIWWKNAAGINPEPYTAILEDDIRGRKWRTADPNRQDISLRYVQQLAADQRPPLMIWPEHCLIGSWGHTVHTTLFDSLKQWERHQLQPITYITKGSTAHTEHYSAIRAEVPDPDVAATQTNQLLIDQLSTAETLLIGGIALSHCVLFTLQHLAEAVGDPHLQRFILLKDCSSPVTGYQALTEQSLNALAKRGLRVLSTEQI